MQDKNVNDYNTKRMDSMICSFCERNRDKGEIEHLFTNGKEGIVTNSTLNICNICIDKCIWLLKIHRNKNIKVISIDYKSKLPELAPDCYDTCNEKTCIKGKCKKE